MLVLTKLDIMDPGTDANELLEGLVVPVKLGIIGVVSRSQKATNEGQSIEECLNKEEQYLRQHYPHVASKNGINYLATALHRVSRRSNIRKLLKSFRADSSGEHQEVSP